MKVAIKNLKKIKKLEFELPNPGVWLLTGLNGSGKTSLLAALYRIGSSNAFARYYKTSSLNNKLDLFNRTKITYSSAETSITYSYGGKRWRGKPSRNSNIFNQFNYPKVIFISADSSRIEPFQNEISHRNVHPANESIRSLMCYILNDQKWDELKYVNTRRGVGNDAYLIPYTYNRAKYYYSEKNFSLGELSIFKLAKSLSSIENDSLVLIDEIEMALHPQAQVRLLDKLNNIAMQKNLTVIFSTHSSTLIKNHDRQNIIFLNETIPGEYEALTNMYPAQILGEMAFDDELGLDFLFYVEDPQAKLLLHQMLGYYFENRNTNNMLPLLKIMYVGGSNEVVKMLNNSSLIFPPFIRRYAFLDDDVRTDTLPNIRDLDLRQLYTVSEVNYLPCTPEVGLMNMLEENNGSSIQNDFTTHFPGHTLNISRIVVSAEYMSLNKQKVREKAKDRINHIVNKIELVSGENSETILKTLYRIYCEQTYGNNIGALHQLFGPIFNAR